MSIRFELYENPESPDTESGGYHIRTVTRGTTKSDEIVKEIQKTHSLMEGDIKSVLSALSDQIAMRLAMSERVHIEGIGYFQVTLQADRDIDPKKLRAQNVWVKSVKFRADQILKNKLKGAGTERSKTKRHSAPLSNDEVDKRVMDFFKKDEFLTRKKLEILCKFTTSTAARHIKRLKAEGKIVNVGMRMSPLYRNASGNQK